MKTIILCSEAKLYKHPDKQAISKLSATVTQKRIISHYSVTVSPHISSARKLTLMWVRRGLEIEPTGIIECSKLRQRKNA